MNGPLQRRLKVNPNQVTEERLDVYLYKGPNVTFNKLFTESSIVHTTLRKRG